MTVSDKSLRDAELQGTLHSGDTLDISTAVRQAVGNCSLAEAAARGAGSMDADQAAVIKGKSKTGADSKGNGKGGKRKDGMGKLEKTDDKNASSSDRVLHVEKRLHH